MTSLHSKGFHSFRTIVADEWALYGAALQYTLRVGKLQAPGAIGIGVVSIEADVNEDIGWAPGADAGCGEAWGYVQEGAAAAPEHAHRALPEGVNAVCQPAVACRYTQDGGGISAGERDGGGSSVGGGSSSSSGGGGSGSGRSGGAGAGAGAGAVQLADITIVEGDVVRVLIDSSKHTFHLEIERPGSSARTGITLNLLVQKGSADGSDADDDADDADDDVNGGETAEGNTVLPLALAVALKYAGDEVSIECG